MSAFFDDEANDYLVLVNDEGQYSLWRGFKAVPPGWTAVGPGGPRGDCLSYIEAHWTDMRPKSLIERMRASMDGQVAAPAAVE